MPSMPAMTADELSALPVTVPLDVAGRAFGLGRTKARQMAQAGTFPCPVKRIGRRQFVLRTDLLAALGADAGDQGTKHAGVEAAPEPPAAPRQHTATLRVTIDGTPYDISCQVRPVEPEKRARERS